MADVQVLLLNDIFLSLNSLNSATKIYKHLEKTLLSDQFPIFWYFGTLFVDYATTGMKYVGELTPGWALLTIVSALIHSANFFLYIISGRHFRRQFIAIVFCKKPEELGVTSTS